MGPRAVLFALVLALLGAAQAVTIEIQDADNLEFRPLEIPGGGETELVVITGSPVRLTVDDDRIIAEYVEFDRESRVLRIVGPGNVAYENVATKGEDYLLDLSSGELNFRDVFIFTEPLDIKGVQATRLPGQIDISGGVFSPCSRCDQQVQDYRFRAERMNLYPGDRLLAFDVTVYLRELPSFFLPLMVIPLGPEERRPRFSITRGTEDERAEVALDWPYVAGANAFGTASLRYYADVLPGGGAGPAETILGGQVEESYLGGGFDHRFYTPRGRGAARLFYTPAFIEEFEEDRRTRDELELTFSYETEEALGGLQTALLLERDDTENQRILNLTARLEETYGGFDFGYVTQTYFDLNLDDDAFSPSYEDAEGALRTYARVQASPEDELSFSVGPFTLTNFLVEAGLYEDYANSGNASAARSPLTLNESPIIRGGRLLERHTITLDTLSPFPGSSVSGSTSYTGQIYTTTNPNGESERLVDWTTLLSAEQTFAGGSFGVDFSRVILEGETPFGFDARTTPNNRTTLSAELALTPLEWLDVSVEETYVFQDNRNLGDVGAGPVETRIELFNNVDWLEAALEQSYDVQENDPGLLGATLGVRAPEDGVLSGSVQLGGVYDLEQVPSGGGDGSTPVNESEVDLEARIGYGTLAALDLAAGYDFNGDPDPFGDFNEGFGDSFGDGLTDSEDDFKGVPLYKPLEVGVSVGTTTQDDALPSLRVFAARDLNLGVMESIGLEAGARLGPLELTAEQTFDFKDVSADDSLLTLSYPDIVELEAEGFSLLPPSLVGLTPDPRELVSYTVSLRDLTQQDLGDGLYELSYETSYGSLLTFDGGGVGFQDTSLSAVVDLNTTFVGTPLGPLGFGVEFTGIVAVADAALPVTYFSNGALELTTDFFSRVALQGGLEYLALYDEAAGGLIQQSLGLSEFGVTVRVWEDLYISALLNDRWDFNDSTTLYPPFNVQPTIYVTLDRCCWALYAALDTETGTISLTLGYPGSEEGLTGAFNSPFILPRREGE